MQEAPAEPGRRPAQQFPGVDLRRPKGYAEGGGGGGAHGGHPCPRCESRDTKFCYYNNYNTSQPRHFCKGCRRYWTKGGTLRNVPVGGGTRKKPSSSPPPEAKKPCKKKRRVVAPAPQPEPDEGAAKPTTAETAATTTTTTDGASEVTTEQVLVADPPAAAAAAAEEEDSLAHLLLQPEADDVALGLGLADLPAGTGTGTGKCLLPLEPDSFEWPPAFDLGACWGGAGFADPDPAGIFLDLP